MTDETTLIKRAQQGNSAAFERLYDQYHAVIFRYVYYRIADQATAEDITADVFVKMVTKIHTFTPGRKPFLAWLYTVAGNLVRDHARRQKRATWVPINDRDNGHVDESRAIHYLQSEEDTLMTMVSRKLTQEQLSAALQELTEDQRQVIVLRFVEGLPIATVAKQISKTVTGVKALQRRALGALRRALEREGIYA